MTHSITLLFWQKTIKILLHNKFALSQARLATRKPNILKNIGNKPIFTSLSGKIT